MISRPPRRRALALSIALLLPLSVAAGAAELAADADEPIPAAPLDAATAAAYAIAADDTEVLEGVHVEGRNEAGGEALYLDERRVSPVVIEALGAEQIARTGDSDAATTLKRVTGLSLVDGKYVYVRGLGERYSSVLLNGAQIPSPDYTRRVVPLDLFPTELLDGILVQKTWSPDLPGQFGGGTVLLRSREVPREFFFRAKGTLGYVDGTTGETGQRYRGGARDWLGYDDGAREMPDSLTEATAGGFLRPQSPTNPDGATPEQLQTWGRDLAALGYGVNGKDIGPDTGFSLATGNGFQLTDAVRLGFVGSLRYDQSWDLRDEQRNEYAASDSGLSPTGSQRISDTRRAIDNSAFLGLGLEIGNAHRIGLTSMLLRQSEDRTRIGDGVFDSQESRLYQLKWAENELVANQLTGYHRFPALHDLEIDWHYTDAKASRDEPDTRNYRYDHFGEREEFSLRSGANSQSFGTLEDNQHDFAIKAMMPFDFDAASLAVSAGAARTTRDRESSIRSFIFQLSADSPLLDDPDFLLNPIDVILAPGNISPDGFVLRETTRATDNYFADQHLDAAFVNADIDFGGKYRLSVGARNERNDQQVTTFSISNPDAAPIVASDQSSEWLPALAFTWAYSDNAQLRAGFSRTLSRPDFRELSSAPYTDPELDITTIGNPDLATTRIRNIDLRWEYYFSDTDHLSIAAFDKDFSDPIEKLRLPGSSPLLGLANADSAHNYGVEFDINKNLGFLGERWLPGFDWSHWHVGLNYARIESSVELDPVDAAYQTNLSRPMQGQSPYVANLQIGYTDPEHGRDATLLFNRFGRRISEVGVQRQPDIYEEARNSLDFQYRQDFADDWRWTLRLRNLLDPEVSYTQGGLPTRSYKQGREVMFSLEWRG